MGINQDRFKGNGTGTLSGVAVNRAKPAMNRVCSRFVPLFCTPFVLAIATHVLGLTHLDQGLTVFPYLFTLCSPFTLLLFPLCSLFGWLVDIDTHSQEQLAYC